MTIKIEYNPSGLQYAEFHLLDAECFPEEPIDRDTFQTAIAGDFWAAWDSRSLVGYCSVARRHDLAWLSRIAVADGYRKRGIATQLMNDILQHCNQIGLADIMLYVKDDNALAMRLYSRFNFRPTEATFQYILSIPKIAAMDLSISVERVRVVPLTEMPKTRMRELPREWANIGEMHQPPHQYVFVFLDQNDGNVGYCRLSPGFPGCFPFAVREPSRHLASIFSGLRPFLLPGADILKLTFADEALAIASSSLGLALNYRLLKMMRFGDTDYSK